MESLAFKVPTVTTSLAGFGEWVMDHYEGSKQGIEVLQNAHPDVDIYIAAKDEKLNENAYIVPGLGDAGDRLYGTK